MVFGLFSHRKHTDRRTDNRVRRSPYSQKGNIGESDDDGVYVMVDIDQDQDGDFVIVGSGSGNLVDHVIERLCHGLGQERSWGEGGNIAS